MGWFGISNTVNRCNNACSMMADVQLVHTLQEKTKALCSELDSQLEHAGRLACVANNAPPTQILFYRNCGLSATASELAAELSIAREDAHHFRNDLSRLAHEIDNTKKLLRSVVKQYDLPRGQRLLRLDEKDRPPTGKQIAGHTKGISQQLLSRAQHFELTHADRAVRTHNIMVKADMIVLGQVSESNRVVNALRQLTSP